MSDIIKGLPNQFYWGFPGIFHCREVRFSSLKLPDRSIKMVIYRYSFPGTEFHFGREVAMKVNVKISSPTIRKLSQGTNKCRLPG